MKQSKILINNNLLKKIKGKEGILHIILIGTKPDIIKQAPLILELKKQKKDVLVIHSGQHYDWNLSGSLEKEFGILPDINKRVTQYFKDEGDVILLLGENKDEQGGSEYLKVIHDKVTGDCPSLDLKTEIALQKTIFDAIQSDLVKSCHDCSEGGLAVALAECCIQAGMGAEITEHGTLNTCLPAGKAELRYDSLLFGETQSRAIISCSNENAAKIEKIAKQNNVPCAKIGQVGGERLIIQNMIDLPLADVSIAWRDAISNLI